MKKRVSILIILVLCLLGLLMGGILVTAETGLPSIDWWVLGGGGEPASGGNITINDTIGQPIVGPSSGGDVGLQAGYWAGAGEGDHTVYLPLILR